MKTWVRAIVVCTCLVMGVGAAASGGAAPAAPEYAALVRSKAFGAHPIRLLLLGDSIALTLGVGMSVGSQAKYGVVISNHASLGCDLDPTTEIITSGKVGVATPGCTYWRTQWPYLTRAENPQVVALGVGRWEISDHLFHGQWVHIGQPVWDNHLMADLRQAIAIFTTFGAKVVLLTMPYIQPLTTQPDGQPFPENTMARADAYNRLVTRVVRADPSQVTEIPFNHMLSPHGVYTSKVDGIRTRWTDDIHITVAGGKYLQHLILPIIDRVGLEAERAASARDQQRLKADAEVRA